MKQNRKTIKYVIDRNRVPFIHEDFTNIATLDEHAKNGIYKVRSVYFDNDDLTALKDRLSQKDDRKKFRIRLYNDDPGFIRLEEKVKHGSIGTKINALLSYKEVEQILNGETEFLKESDDPLKQEFYEFIKNEHIHPMVIVEYIREPYTMDNEKIRLTLDYNIKASKDTKEFLDPDLPLSDLIEDKAIIEIKWPEELPESIKEIIKREQLEPVDISKYTSTYNFLTQ